VVSGSLGSRCKGMDISMIRLFWRCGLLGLALGCQDSDAPKDDDLAVAVPVHSEIDGATGEDASDDSSDSTGGSAADSGSVPVDFLGFEPCLGADGDDITIDSVSDTTDGILMVEVTYGGGCETHFFQLCWPEQSFMESAPVQASLELLHTAPPYDCYPWVTETLELDLLPMADAWREIYGSESGEMIVHLGGFTTLYSF